MVIVYNLLYISPCLHRGLWRGRVLAAGGAGLGLDAGVRADPGVGVAGVGVEVLHHHVVQHPGLQALDGGEEAGLNSLYDSLHDSLVTAYLVPG